MKHAMIPMLVLLLSLTAQTGFAKKKSKKGKAEVKPSCEVTVEGNDQMQFNVKMIKFAKDCDTYTLTLKHTGQLPMSAMGHNVVITKKEHMNEVVQASQKVGLEGGYLPEDSPKVLAATKLLGGGESDTIKIAPKALKKKGELVFFCSFPGHFAIMKGSVVIQ